MNGRRGSTAGAALGFVGDGRCQDASRLQGARLAPRKTLPVHLRPGLIGLAIASVPLQPGTTNFMMLFGNFSANVNKLSFPPGCHAMDMCNPRIGRHNSSNIV